MDGQPAPHERQLLALEQRLHQPDFRHDAVALTNVLADDFLEIDGNGRTYTKPSLIAKLQRERPTVRKLSGFDTREVSPDVYLVSYLSLRRDPATGRETTTRRASIWRHTDGAWKMAFHRRMVEGRA
jgi:hypothetical protein